jgi:hypothetical protein
MANPDEGDVEPDASGETPATQRVRAVLMAPGGDKLTLAEVAKRAKVSVSTVATVRKRLHWGAGLDRLRRAWQEATAEEKRQFLDEVIQEGR